MTTAEHLIEPTVGRARPVPWPTRETLDNLARSPTLHIPRPGKPPVQLATDRVRARPALTPTLAGALGMGAVGLGLWGLFAPRSVTKSLGINASPTTVRAVFGLRELAVGYGLLGDPTKAGLLWARVAGDMFDIAVLHKAAHDERNPKQANAKLALNAVLAITAADVVAATRMTNVQRDCVPQGGRR